MLTIFYTRILFSDAVAVVVALLYSVLLLVLSYSLATPPTPAAVRRAVDKHSNFQYLWSLKFADFLLDRRAVTPKVNLQHLLAAVVCVL